RPDEIAQVILNAVAQGILAAPDGLKLGGSIVPDLPGFVDPRLNCTLQTAVRRQAIPEPSGSLSIAGSQKIQGSPRSLQNLQNLENLGGINHASCSYLA